MFALKNALDGHALDDGGQPLATALEMDNLPVNVHVPGACPRRCWFDRPRAPVSASSHPAQTQAGVSDTVSATHCADIASNFVRVNVKMDTTTLTARERKLIELYLEAFFQVSRRFGDTLQSP